MPWLCVDHMIHQGVWLMGFSYPDPLVNPDPLAKSRPTGKIQTHWLGHKVVHIVTRNIQKSKSCFHQYFIYIQKFNKTMASKENRIVDRCMRTDGSRCDPSRITLDLRSLVIWLGSQLEESFLTHMSTIRFSLRIGCRAKAFIHKYL